MPLSRKKWLVVKSLIDLPLTHSVWGVWGNIDIRSGLFGLFGEIGRMVK